MCIFYGDVVALQYGRRAHFRAQGLGRPSSSRPNFFVLVCLDQSYCKKPRVVQYTRTVTVRTSHVSIRTDRTDRQQGYTFCKVCFTVRKSHLISGTVCRSVRIERIDKRGIRSVKSVLQSVIKSHLISGT